MRECVAEELPDLSENLLAIQQLFCHIGLPLVIVNGDTHQKIGVKSDHCCTQRADKVARSERCCPYVAKNHARISRAVFAR